MLARCLCVILALTAGRLSAGEFSSGGCTARWNDTTLTVGNALFSRTYVCRGDDLATTSWKHGEFEWIDAARAGQPDGSLTVVAEKGRRYLTGAEGLRIQVTTGARARTLWLFPGVAGVILESPRLARSAEWKPSDRLYENIYAKLPYHLAGADVLRLAPRHVEVKEDVLQDMTDLHNELVERNSWLIMTREEALVRRAPIVSAEDSASGEGIVCLRLAPLPHDRADSTPDFVFGASEGWKAPNRVFVASVANGYPVAEIAFKGGRVGRIRALHAVQRTLRQYRAGRDGIFLTNTWGDGNRDARINADFMMAEVRAGGELGVDVIQIDDGWQSGKSSNSALIKDRTKGSWGNFRAANPDFWKLDPVKFPGGLGPIVAAAKERGMGFGLWFGPDKTDDYAGWALDADTLLGFYRDFGVRYFKIDGIGMGSEKGLANIRRMFDRMLAESNGEMTFDLDVTGAAKRPGYFGVPDIGPLFLENRYINGGTYWPHFTLRNLWTLCEVLDPVRLRVEIANPLHGTEHYGEDPLAPKFWRGDTLFATVMIGSPLGWFEISELDPKTVAEMKPLVAAWKRERANLHGGSTIPVGAKPDGFAWTGFVTEGADGRSAYALVFRELNDAADYRLNLDGLVSGAFARAEVIGGRGTAQLAGDELVLKVPAKLDFIWVKLVRAASQGKKG